MNLINKFMAGKATGIEVQILEKQLYNDIRISAKEGEKPNKIIKQVYKKIRNIPKFK